MTLIILMSTEQQHHLGDISETKAIIKFSGSSYKLNISSTKSMTGHLLGAAGAVEAIAAILATKYDIVPPTINFTDTRMRISIRN